MHEHLIEPILKGEKIKCNIPTLPPLRFCQEATDQTPARHDKNPRSQEEKHEREDAPSITEIIADEVPQVQQ